MALPWGQGILQGIQHSTQTVPGRGTALGEVMLGIGGCWRGGGGGDSAVSNQQITVLAAGDDEGLSPGRGTGNAP